MKTLGDFDLIFQVHRKEYFKDTTIGELLLPETGEKFSWTLEDEVRAMGVKVPGHTAIPSTGLGHAYCLELRESPKYGEVPVIFTSKNGSEYILEGPDGVVFKYILIHGGNDDDDTEGCILVAKNRIGLDKIQGAQHRVLVEIIKKYIATGKKLGISIVNMPQENTKFAS